MLCITLCAPIQHVTITIFCLCPPICISCHAELWQKRSNRDSTDTASASKASKPASSRPASRLQRTTAPSSFVPASSLDLTAVSSQARRRQAAEERYGAAKGQHSQEQAAGERFAAPQQRHNQLQPDSDDVIDLLDSPGQPFAAPCGLHCLVIVMSLGQGCNGQIDCRLISVKAPWESSQMRKLVCVYSGMPDGLEMCSHARQTAVNHSATC